MYIISNLREKAAELKEEVYLTAANAMFSTQLLPKLHTNYNKQYYD